MNYFRTSMVVFFFLLVEASLAQHSDRNYLPYSMDNTEQRVLHSTMNGVDYKLYISYPPSFKKNRERHYPVLYLLDADYSFAIAKNMVDHLTERGHLKEIIVVGIAYNGEKRYRINRTRDYTPTNSEEQVTFSNIQSEYSGGGKAFKNFIERELMPFVKKEYRGNEVAAISGHSYGGLFASWVLTQNPTLFDGYIIVSPSLWYDDHLIMNSDWKLNQESVAGIKVFCAVGDREINQLWNMPRGLKGFVALLKTKQIDGLNLKMEIHNNETHNSIFPGALSNGIRHVFNGH